ncbi:MAG: hypothetical protein MUP82_00125 [Candidatus Marinimicrobia bacterium]|nr:hypothetical protein [Candidatus Neomarinimicrobiota bacterium]
MNNQTGGVKLVDTIPDEEKVGFRPVSSMIENPESSISLLTAGSLYGFMFNFKVNKTDSKYRTLDTAYRFTNPVEQFILKIVVTVGKNHSRGSLGALAGVEKRSERETMFCKEAELQQKIWVRSITGGKPAICPPVANFAVFKNAEGKQLLELITKRTPPGPPSRTTWLEYLTGLTPFAASLPIVPTKIAALEFLKHTLEDRPKFGIGVLTMPTITNSTTLFDFYSLPEGSNFNGLNIKYRNKMTAFAYVIAQTVRLFVHIGVIHYDLHLKNALIYITDDKQIKGMLIDFGQALDITASVGTDPSLLADQAEENAKKEDFFNRQFATTNLSDEDKAAFMFDVMDYLADKGGYDITNPKGYQMSWYESFRDRSGTGNKRIMKEAFDILITLTVNIDSKLGNATIQRLVADGLILNIYEHSVDDKGNIKYVSPEEILDASASDAGKKNSLSDSDAESDSDNDTMFGVFPGGGKRKIKKNRRTRNKNKKTTKTVKTQIRQ